MNRLRRAIALTCLALGWPVHALASNAGLESNLARMCSGCHGSSETAPALAGQLQDYLRKQLHDYREGRRRHRDMDAIAADMSNEQIAALAREYSMQPALEGRRQNRLGEAALRRGFPERGVAACASCHGAEGQGNERLEAPRLAGQRASYTKRQILNLRRGVRANDEEGACREALAGLRYREVQAIADYFDLAQGSPRSVTRNPWASDPERGSGVIERNGPGARSTPVT